MSTVTTEDWSRLEPTGAGWSRLEPAGARARHASRRYRGDRRTHAYFLMKSSWNLSILSIISSAPGARHVTLR